MKRLAGQPRSPPRTSASSFEDYLDGRLLVSGEGPAWRRLPAQLYRRPHVQEPIVIPAVAEPQIVWVVRGRAEIFERELGEDRWRGGEVVAGMFFLTDSAEPYELRWEATGSVPFEVLMVHLDLTLLRRAWAETGAGEGVLRNVSRGLDPQLSAWLEMIRAELVRERASAMLVEGMAQNLVVHVVRHYADAGVVPVASRQRLTAFKLRRIEERMEARLDRELDLAALARHVELSPSHLSRVFRQTTGETLSDHFVRLRMAAACRLLRETDGTVIQVALAVGYATHSHFTHVFRRRVGQTPTRYRSTRNS